MSRRPAGAPTARPAGEPLSAMACDEHGNPAQPRRSPLLAVLLSGLFPGLGQLYNRQWLKALLFGVGSAVVGFGPLSPLTVDIDPDDPASGLARVLVTSLPFLAIALWSVIDAYRAARRPD